MNLYMKIFATFILPIALGLIFTLYSLNSVLNNQKNLITKSDKIEIQHIEQRFDTVLKNIQRDLNIISNSNDIVKSLELHDNNTLSNWGKSFLGDFYSTIIFVNDENYIVSRASDQYRFGDQLDEEIINKINQNIQYKGIVIIDEKEVLLYAKHIRDFTNKRVGSVLLGVTINEIFLQNITNKKNIALLYKSLHGLNITSKNVENIIEIKPFKTNISTIDKNEVFLLQVSQNAEIKALENFKRNILIFSIIICIIIVFLLYFILSNFLRPYKKIYNLLLDFTNNKIDFNYIKNASRSISQQTRSKEIYYMARAINKVSKKVIKHEESLKKISYTDQLTKVLNRRKLDEILLKEAYQSNRYNQELSLILIDIDYFKTINDNYGHQVGDKILKQFSTLVNTHLRTSDFFGRWGGEEFLIICPNTNMQGALALAQKVQNLTRNFNYTHDITLTASYGIAQILKDESFNGLMSRTDEALYKAKNTGRDKIETADQNSIESDTHSNDLTVQ